MAEKFVEIWSRGGGINRYDHDTGTLVESTILEIEGFILKVFHNNGNYLLQLNDGYVALYDGEIIQVRAKLSGPITSAVWCESSKGWFISGWREIIFLSNNFHQRKELQEIPVYYDYKRKITLCNDSNWYKVQLNDEEE